MATGTIVYSHNAGTPDPPSARGHMFGPDMRCQRSGCKSTYAQHIEKPSRCYGTRVRHHSGDSNAQWAKKLKLINEGMEA